MNPIDKSAEIRRQFKLALDQGGRPDVQQYVAELADGNRDELARELTKLQAEHHSVMETMDIVAQGQVGNANDSTHAADFTIEQSHSEGQQRSGEEKPPAYVGRYEIGRPIGRGGFGSVYLGWDPQLEREVAVKIPRFRQSDSEKLKQRVAAFLAEARAAVQLEHHPGIVPVYDAGMEDSNCYIVSQYVAGGSLNELSPENELSLAEKLRFVATLADTIAFAHDRGWIHRDIKPSNILIDHAGKPYLTDFGLTLRAEDLGKSSGLVEGTPKYMAPEQAQAARVAIRGQGDAPKIDHRSDIYSLGVVFYGMLTGDAPHGATGLTELLDEVIDKPIVAPHELSGDIPSSVGKICMRALEKDPARRYQSAAEFRDQLLAQAEAIESASSTDFNESQSSNVWIQAAIVGGVILLLLAGVGVWWMSGSRDSFIAPTNNNQNNVAMAVDAEETRPVESLVTDSTENETTAADDIAPTQKSPVGSKDDVKLFVKPPSPGGGVANQPYYVEPSDTSDPFGFSRLNGAIGSSENPDPRFQFRSSRPIDKAKLLEMAAEYDQLNIQSSEQAETLQTRKAQLARLLADSESTTQQIAKAVDDLKKIADNDIEALQLIGVAYSRIAPLAAPESETPPTVIDD